jgi:hypothetical protein
MNRAREGLATGITEAELPAFRRMVLEAVDFVEQSCRESGVSPWDLPAPSRRAYEFLKGIDLDNVPVREGAMVEGSGKIRISNIVSSCKGFQQDFARYARQAASGGSGERPREELLLDLHARIAALASSIEKLVAQFGAGPSALPDPTRRAYQWLKYLSDDDALRQHCRALRMAYETTPDAHTAFYHMAGLYRSRTRKGGWHVTLNEAFVGAPRPIIRSLMRVTTGKAKAGDVPRLRRYAQGEEFGETSLDLELIGIRPQENARGAYYDLKEVFDRVNVSNFEGRMDPPILTWNRTITHAKFGHYVPATDTVMISIALDSPEVPGYVIEHVMHHELLHRELGVKFVNGRRVSHSPAFRARERSFDRYAQAAEFLGGLSRKLR